MVKDRLLKQVKPRPRVGAFQVQVSTTMSHYMIYINMSFMGMMFWHTTAAPFLRQYYIGASFWMFAIFMLLLVTAIGFFDYKFVYPSRQGFLNMQSYRHANPAVYDLKKLLENDTILLENDRKIMKKLGIK